jgi:hypothetical protein
VPTPITAKWPKPKSEDEFEDISVDFLRIRWQDPNVTRYGRRGQRQYGVDIVGSPYWLNGRRSGAQCKNTDSLNLAIVISEVEKAIAFPEELCEFLIVAACDRDAMLQSAIRNHYQKNPVALHVDIVFWPDIVSDLSNDSQLVAKYWKGFAQPSSMTVNIFATGGSGGAGGAGAGGGGGGGAGFGGSGGAGGEAPPRRENK